VNYNNYLKRPNPQALKDELKKEHPNKDKLAELVEKHCDPASILYRELNYQRRVLDKFLGDNGRFFFVNPFQFQCFLCLKYNCLTMQRACNLQQWDKHCREQHPEALELVTALRKSIHTREVSAVQRYRDAAGNPYVPKHQPPKNILKSIRFISTGEVKPAARSASVPSPVVVEDLSAPAASPEASVPDESGVGSRDERDSDELEHTQVQ